MQPHISALTSLASLCNPGKSAEAGLDPDHGTKPASAVPILGSSVIFSASLSENISLDLVFELLQGFLHSRARITATLN
jgi:hypothetical protein